MLAIFPLESLLTIVPDTGCQVAFNKRFFCSSVRLFCSVRLFFSVKEIQLPDLRPSKSCPVHLMVPSFSEIELPILIAPFISNFSIGFEIPIPKLLLYNCKNEFASLPFKY